MVVIAAKRTLRRVLDGLRLSKPARDTFNWTRHLLDFRAQLENARFRSRGAPDGLPIPSPRMVYLVSGQYRIEPFLENGRIGAACIREMLSKHGIDASSLSSVLDFGCGCGRVMRQWRSLEGTRLYGTDSNPLFVNWCKEAYPFAEFNLNSHQASLPYRDGQFDFVYAISVFTHLVRPFQDAWIAELRRVLADGGHLYLTTCGASFAHKLTKRDRSRFDSGEMVVLGGHFSSDNVCMVYHPECYVREVLAKDFVVRDFVHLGAKDAGQDVYLLQKPAGALLQIAE